MAKKKAKKKAAKKKVAKKPPAKKTKEMLVIINLPYRLTLESLGGVSTLVRFCRREYTKNIVIVANKATMERPAPDVEQQKFFRQLTDQSSQRAPAKLLKVRSVDTCDRWLAGFGQAVDLWPNTDRLCLLPGDFVITQQSIATLRDLLDQTLNPENEMVVGTISADPLSPKQLIDTYATYALLLVWFPHEAKQLIENGISKPRSEFFGISRTLLDYAMNGRWFAYSQTLVILLRYLWWGNLKRKGLISVPLSVGPESGVRSLSEAITQLERIERVLRFMWREKANPEGQLDVREYELLDSRSAAARKLAISVFSTLVAR